jgi:hypothetical protein
MSTNVLNLVLNLDNTLILSTPLTRPPTEEDTRGCACVLDWSLNSNNNKHTFSVVRMRPALSLFFQSLRQISDAHKNAVNVTVWTASKLDYALVTLLHIDKQCVVRHVVARDVKNNKWCLFERVSNETLPMGNGRVYHVPTLERLSMFKRLRQWNFGNDKDVRFLNCPLNSIMLVDDNEKVVMNSQRGLWLRAVPYEQVNFADRFLTSVASTFKHVLEGRIESHGERPVCELLASDTEPKYAPPKRKRKVNIS